MKRTSYRNLCLYPEQIMKSDDENQFSQRNQKLKSWIWHTYWEISKNREINRNYTGMYQIHILSIVTQPHVKIPGSVKTTKYNESNLWFPIFINRIVTKVNQTHGYQFSKSNNVNQISHGKRRTFSQSQETQSRY